MERCVTIEDGYPKLPDCLDWRTSRVTPPRTHGTHEIITPRFRKAARLRGSEILEKARIAKTAKTPSPTVHPTR